MRKLTIELTGKPELLSASDFNKITVDSDGPRFALLYKDGAPTNELFVCSFGRIVQLNGDRFWNDFNHVGPEYTFELVYVNFKL